MSGAQTFYSSLEASFEMAAKPAVTLGYVGAQRAPVMISQ